MKLYVFNTSYSLLSRWIMFPTNDLPESEGPVMGDPDWFPYLAPVPCVLIDHPDGWILFDTGFDKQLMEDSNKEISPFWCVWNDGMDIEKSLAMIGIEPKDVKTVVVSHLHPDHIGQISKFADATVYVPGQEMDGPHFPFEDSLPEGLNINFVKVYEDTEIADGVEIIKLPGHTVDHQGLKVDLENTGTVVFAADALYSQEHLDKGLVSKNATHKKESYETINKLKKYQEDGVIVMPGHDMRVLTDLAVFPDYVD